MSEMSIDEAISIIENCTVSSGECCTTEFILARDKAIEALKFQQEYQEIWDKNCKIKEKDYQQKVQRCIERMENRIGATYYASVNGNHFAGGENSAFHEAEKIIKEEMGCEE